MYDIPAGIGGKRMPNAKKVRAHLYFCEQHYPMMMDFIGAYEGRLRGHI